jgi:hypothetical protein
MFVPLVVLLCVLHKSFMSGKMEIVAGSNYYEGKAITIYRCDPKKVEALLSVSCGA